MSVLTGPSGLIQFPRTADPSSEWTEHKIAYKASRETLESKQEQNILRKRVSGATLSLGPEPKLQEPPRLEEYTKPVLSLAIPQPAGLLLDVNVATPCSIAGTESTIDFPKSQDPQDQEDALSNNDETPSAEFYNDHEYFFDNESEDEEEEPETNPIYLTISTNARFKSLWESSNLILLPPRRMVPPLDLLSQPTLLASVPNSLSPIPATPTSATITIPTTSPSQINANSFEFVRGAKGAEGEQPGRGASTHRNREELENYVSAHAFHSIGRGELYQNNAESKIQVRVEFAKGLVVQVPRRGSRLPSAAISVTGSETSVSSSPSSAPYSDTASSDGTSIDSRSVNSYTPDIRLNPTQETVTGPIPGLPDDSSPDFGRKFQIVAETPVYRRTKPTYSVPDPLPPPPAKPKPAFSVAKWLRRGAPTAPARLGLPKDKIKPSGGSGGMERVRIVTLDSEIISVPSFATVFKEKATGRLRAAQKSSISLGGRSYFDKEKRARPLSISSSRSIRSYMSTSIPSSSAPREFLSDVAFLASPPIDDPIVADVLKNSLETLLTLVEEFHNVFVLIPIYEKHTLQRIKKGIVDKTWKALQQELRSQAWTTEDSANVLAILENVALGLLFNKLYTGYSLPQNVAQNHMSNQVIATYKECKASLLDLGFEYELEENAFEEVISIVNTLCQPSKNEHLITEDLLNRCNLRGERDPNLQSQLLEAKTPLDYLSIMRRSLGIVIRVCEQLVPGIKVSTDDIISLIMWIVVQSAVQNWDSILHHIQSFKLGEMDPSFDWTLTIFVTALHSLARDPLHLLVPSPILTVSDVDHSPPATVRRASDLLSFRTRHNSLHFPQTPPDSPHSMRPSSVRSQPGSLLGHAHRMSLSPTSSSAHKSAECRANIKFTFPESRESFDSTDSLRNRSDHSRESSCNDSNPTLTTASSARRLRRQSLGVLPNMAGVGFDPLPNSQWNLSSSSLSSPQEVQILPRLVPLRTARTWQPTLEPPTTKSIPIGRTLSATSRQLGASSLDMRRSGSDSAVIGSPKSSLRRTFTAADNWLNGEEAPTEPVEDQSSWMEWGRDILIGSSGTTSPPSTNEGRSRRHSTSSPMPRPRSLDSSALLAAALGAKDGSLRTKTRPMSMLSVSSMDSDSHISYSLETSSMISHRPRALTQSLMRRDLAVSSILLSSPALAPRLDSTTALAFSVSADGCPSTNDRDDMPGLNPDFSSATLHAPPRRRFESTSVLDLKRYATTGPYQ